MPHLYPAQLPNRVRQDPKRSAEVKFYESLRLQLDQRWVVFYGVAWLGLNNNGTPPSDGEIDFLVAHPEHGVLLIEVKGGRIRYDSERTQWITTDRDNVDHDIDPFPQVRKCKYALLEKIKTLPKWGNRWIVLGHAVAFPDVIIPHTELPPDAPIEILLDATMATNLPARFIEILDYWHGQDGSVQDEYVPLIADLERLLAPHTELHNPLSVQVAEEDREIIQLTEEQFTTLGLLSRIRRAAICGCAGSGKTMLAVEKAKRLAQEGFHTLLTCYSAPLAEHLAHVTKDLTNLEVCAFRKLGTKVARGAGIESIEPGNEEQAAYTLSQAIRTCPDLRYDAILVDEGQDFEDTAWLALDDCLRDGTESVFYVFFDDNQRVYGQCGGIPADLPHFPLVNNVRNTRTIHRRLVQYYESFTKSVPRGPQGRNTEAVKYQDVLDLKRQLGRVLHRLTVNEAVASRDIVVLTPKEREDSALVNTTLENGFRMVESASSNVREIQIATIPEFKGLERPIVVVAELDEELLSQHETREAICYVAFSRPRHHLILLGKSAVLSVLG